MVTRLILILFLFPSFLLSGEFVASVNRNQVNVGESFNLTLTLKNTSAKGVPATTPLNQHFHLLSQHQSNQTSIINGKVTSSTSWQFTLSPLREGEAIIPPLKIDTSEGPLTSQPITIRASKGSADSRSGVNDGINLTFDINNAAPYKNEPFVYTIRLASSKQVSNITAHKFNVDDAIVETHGEPKVYNRVINGIQMGIVEFSYLITPLKAGRLKIPSIVIEGITPMEAKMRRRSFFDDDFDPFSLMHGFERLQPFALATEEVPIEVQPSVMGMTPWLPARSLTLEESWNNAQPLQVGEPLTRVIRMNAEGLKASQLPSLDEQQTADQNFKVYADKPDLKDEINGGQIKSSRTEQYTLIPQQAGVLTLPEVSVTWWDAAKKEKMVAKIPARTLQIQPAPVSIQPTQAITIVQGTAIPRDPLLYVIIGILSLLLAGAIVWMILLQRKVSRATQNKKVKVELFSEEQEPPPSKNKKEKLPDLNPT